MQDTFRAVKKKRRRLEQENIAASRFEGRHLNPLTEDEKKQKPIALEAVRLTKEAIKSGREAIQYLSLQLATLITTSLSKEVSAGEHGVSDNERCVSCKPNGLRFEHRVICFLHIVELNWGECV